MRKETFRMSREAIKRRFLYVGKCFIHRDRNATWLEQFHRVALCDECKEEIGKHKPDYYLSLVPYKGKRFEDLKFNHIPE